VPAERALPEVPQPAEAEIDLLLDTVGPVLEQPLTRADVIGSFAGLRPLLARGEEGETSDLSRRHAILESSTGLLSVVGGKLTTYRRMAQDAVDVATARRFAGGSVPPSATRTLPLVGAWPRHLLPEVGAPARFVRRYGAEAPFAAALPSGPAAARGVTAQELQWGVEVEGALTVDDLLDRRTRLGLVARDRASSEDAAVAAFERAGVEPA
jgi:glycerol-3-phosphate dehydrogenase